MQPLARLGDDRGDRALAARLDRLRVEPQLAALVLPHEHAGHAHRFAVFDLAMPHVAGRDGDADAGVAISQREVPAGVVRLRAVHFAVDRDAPDGRKAPGDLAGEAHERDAPRLVGLVGGIEQLTRARLLRRCDELDYAETDAGTSVLEPSVFHSDV